MKLTHALAALPLLAFASVGSAAEPIQLSEGEMDQVTAGFASVALADATGLGAIVNTATMTEAYLQNYARGTINKTVGNENIPGQASLTLVKASANSASSSLTLPFVRLPIPTTTP